jgi:glycosyltransferase involved in cell wall biosynthesis
MTRPLKVLFLLSATRRAATYVRAHHLGLELSHLGHKITLMLVSDRKRFRRTVTGENGLRVIETPNLFHENLGSEWNRIYLEPGTGPLDVYARIREGLSGGYDIIQAFDHGPNVSVPISFLRKRVGIPVISDWCDIYYLPGGLRDLYHTSYDFIYRKVGFPFIRYNRHTELSLRRKADAITAISRPLARLAIQYGIPEEKIFVVRGGADVVELRPLPKEESRRQLGLPIDKKIVAFMGTFQGDLDLLMRAVAIVSQRAPDTYLLVVGTSMTWHRRLAHDLGIGARYIEAGRCSDEMLPRYLASADTLCLPLRRNLPNETRWPNKIGEYMASGRPTVVTRVGEVAEVVEARGIGLVAAPAVDDLAAKIERLLADPALADALGRKAREVACNEHTWGHRAQELEEVYRTVLSRKRGGGAS